MNILLTNDDGIYAKGLWAVYEHLKDRHNVTVVAPDRERSAVGHGITLHEPLHASKVHVNGGWIGFAVNGTPVDCIKLGFVEILDSKPDIVISGINPGANVGVNINYSGTVAAAKEAALYGVPAIAGSIQGDEVDDYGDIASFMEELAEYVFQKGLPFGTILNVNFPCVTMGDCSGIRISKQGLTHLSENFEKRQDPRNRTYYWYGNDLKKISDNSEIDTTALDEKFISITPIQCDMTDYSILEDLKKWKIGQGR
jgi:5'-nucleotidase